MALVHAVTFLPFAHIPDSYLNGLTVTTQHSLAVIVLVADILKYRIGHNGNLHRQRPTGAQTSISP